MGNRNSANDTPISFATCMYADSRAPLYCDILFCFVFYVQTVPLASYT